MVQGYYRSHSLSKHSSLTRFQGCLHLSTTLKTTFFPFASYSPGRLTRKSLQRVDWELCFNSIFSLLQLNVKMNQSLERTPSLYLLQSSRREVSILIRGVECRSERLLQSFQDGLRDFLLYSKADKQLTKNKSSGSFHICHTKPRHIFL